MNKKKIALIMTAAMAASMMFAGCGKTVDSSVSGSASTAATGETATSESSKTVTVDYSIGLKKNGYYKDVKAKKVDFPLPRSDWTGQKSPDPQSLYQRG